MLINGLLTISLAICAVCVLAVPVDLNTNDVVLDPKSEYDSVHTDVQTTLHHGILSRLNKSVDPCEDIYLHTCSEEENYWTPRYLRDVYPNIRNHLINILSRNPSENELNSLSIEKRLFQQCMNLGAKESEEAKNDKKELINSLFEIVFRSNETWQTIDENLNKIGFGHTFFDINVERDPENPIRNIISLQPPSHAHIQHLKSLIEEAFIQNHKDRKVENFVQDFYISMNKKYGYSIQTFFSKFWLPVFFFGLTKSEPTIKMSINHLNSLNKHGDIDLSSIIKSHSTDSEFSNFIKNLESFDTESNKIDWLNMMQQHFSYNGIRIDDDETILVKHKPYFLLLNKILSILPNEMIVAAIKTKFVTENLRYINWREAESLEHKKRSTFCFEDTKLYGASFRLIRDLKKEESQNGPYYEIVEEMLNEIVDVMNDEITNSKVLSQTEQTFLKSEMKLITSNALHHNRSFVSNYYTDDYVFLMADSYFGSILRYRKLLNINNIKTLRDVSTHRRVEPFSITDLENPRNRFILSIFVNSNSPLSRDLPKEVHYGIYGVKVAGFLFGLLNEKRVHDPLNDRKPHDWFTHPTYSTDAVQCFISESQQTYGKSQAAEILTELFGVRIAYKAMLKDYLDEGDRQYFVSKSIDNVVTADQLFFLSYAKYHCHLGKKLMNSVFSNLNEYNYAFDCYEKTANELPKCHLKGFQIQDKSIFLSQS